ncbi:MAG: aminotransferase class I/II-fold pyridoxal phosphate-dependent enzyme [Cyanobacteria bacterium J06627_28]
MLDQSCTPLLHALMSCTQRQHAAFYTPGHKRGQGTTSHHQLFGQLAFQADLPELPELDNLFAPEGVIAEAQALAAQLFGADKTWFLANGSTCGIEAALLAVAQPSEKIIIPRNAHTSVISGLVLSGAAPIYVAPDYSHTWDIPLAISPDTIAQALSQHPDAKAVVLVSPTYHGICSNVAAIAAITQQHNIPLIVDAAHGPHFAFHPALPTSALAAGADIVIHSTHKVLSAFTQAAMLHVKGRRIDTDRISQALQLTQSTSPSYLLLGSLDAARHQMATAGPALMAQTIALADSATEGINQLEGLSVLQPHWTDDRISDQNTAKEDTSKALIPQGDRTRLTVNVTGLGITGFQADEELHTQYCVTAELPALCTLTFIVSLGNTEQDISRLINGFKQLSQQRLPSNAAPALINHSANVSFSETELLSTVGEVITPRKAFFAAKRALPSDQAIGKLCAETICPYPPGIPLLLPGEKITASAIAQLKTTLSAGGLITGCQDPTLQTILTVAD